MNARSAAFFRSVARAATGQIAPPMSMMNSRRFG
jgi:hypothetical protein